LSGLTSDEAQPLEQDVAALVEQPSLHIAR